MSEKKEMTKTRSIIFAVIMCVVCSLILIAAASGLKKRQLKNVQNDKRKNILKATGLIDEDTSYTYEQIESLSLKNIKVYYIDKTGLLFSSIQGKKNLLKIYLYTKGDNIESYVLPIDSRGLWGKIKGYLALENDGSTIAGFTVYSHNETPGLGGEIESSWFRKNFIGKKIVNKKKSFVSISIAKGKVPSQDSENYVDGISGATLTGKFLTSGIKEVLTEYEPISIRFRSGLLKGSPKK